MSHDPKNYEKMSVPFATTEEATEAIEGFLEAVRKARQKYRMANVTVALCANLQDSEKGIATYAHFGDSRAAVPLSAYVIASERAKLAEPLRAIDEAIGHLEKDEP